MFSRGVPDFIYVGFLTHNSIITVHIFGKSPEYAGLLVNVASVAYTVAASQAGRIAGAFDGLSAPPVGSTVLLGVGFATLAVVPSFWVGFLGVVVLGVDFGVGLSLYRSQVTRIAPATHRGSLVSVGKSLGLLAATVALLVVGGVVENLISTLGF